MAENEVYRVDRDNFTEYTKLDRPTYRTGWWRNMPYLGPQGQRPRQTPESGNRYVFILLRSFWLEPRN
jgi:hypothetical protein